MKRFQSRIESLRRVREQAEKLARLQAAMCQMEKQKADQRVNEINEQLKAIASDGLHGLQHGQVEIVQSIVSATARLEAEKKIAAEQQAEAQKTLEDAIRKVAEAKKTLNVAETHIQQERTEHRRQNHIAEENDRQENSAQRFARSQN